MKASKTEEYHLEAIISNLGEVEVISHQIESKAENYGKISLSIQMVKLLQLVSISFIEKNIEMISPLIIDIICCHPDQDIKMNYYHLLIKQYNKETGPKKNSIISATYKYISLLDGENLLILMKLVMDRSNLTRDRILFGIKILLHICFIINPSCISGMIWPYLWEIYFIYPEHDICNSTVALSIASISYGFDSFSIDMLKQFVQIALDKDARFNYYNIQFFKSLWTLLLFKDSEIYEDLNDYLIKRIFYADFPKNPKKNLLLEYILKAIYIRILTSDNDDIITSTGSRFKPLASIEVLQYFDQQSHLSDITIEWSDLLQPKSFKYFDYYVEYFLKVFIEKLRETKFESLGDHERIGNLFKSTSSFFGFNLIQTLTAPYMEEMNKLEEDGSEQILLQESSLLFLYLELFYMESTDSSKIVKVSDFEKLLKTCSSYFIRTRHSIQYFNNLYLIMLKLRHFEDWAILLIQKLILNEKNEDEKFIFYNLTALLNNMNDHSIQTNALPILQYMEYSNHITYVLQTLKITLTLLNSVKSQNIKEILTARILSFIENWDFVKTSSIIKEILFHIFLYSEICPTYYFLLVMKKFETIYSWGETLEFKEKYNIVSLMINGWVTLLRSESFFHKVTIQAEIKCHLEKVMHLYLTPDLDKNRDMARKIANEFNRFFKKSIANIEGMCSKMVK